MSIARDSSGGASSASAQGRANRARGARAEVAVVNWLKANGWPDARRYLAGDGCQPGDIDAIAGVAIEVKDVAKLAWPAWREQALAEADWRIPIVVRRTRGVVDAGSWEAHVYDPVNPYPSDAKTVVCPRTGRLWAVSTFAEIVCAVTA